MSTRTEAREVKRGSEGCCDTQGVNRYLAPQQGQGHVRGARAVISTDCWGVLGVTGSGCMLHLASDRPSGGWRCRHGLFGVVTHREVLERLNQKRTQ